MEAKLSYIIEFVADMDRAVKTYRDVIGLALKFQSPEWSEFATGAVTLALHAASEKNPAGKLEMGLSVPNLQEFHTEMQGKGVHFSMPPSKQDLGSMLAQFTDSEGASITVSGN
jgi:lactoylglutathione lyase